MIESTFTALLLSLAVECEVADYSAASHRLGLPQAERDLTALRFPYNGRQLETSLLHFLPKNVWQNKSQAIGLLWVAQWAIGSWSPHPCGKKRLWTGA